VACGRATAGVVIGVGVLGDDGAAVVVSGLNDGSGAGVITKEGGSGKLSNSGTGGSGAREPGIELRIAARSQSSNRRLFSSLRSAARHEPNTVET
jgi:hypothetical protein